MRLRPALGLLHRWLGLAVALFLIVSGATGAVVSWDHELDEWLNPQLFERRSQGPTLAPLALVAIVEQADPRVRVSGFPLAFEDGHNAEIWVDARIDPATGRRFEPGYDHVFVDPVTGAIVGRRLWGQLSLHPEHLMSFLYKLHYTLHLPEWRGSDQWGVWLMGVVALVWLVDSCIAFALTLPRRARNAGATKGWWQRWQPAWRVRWAARGYKLHFDLHRAGGLWVWAIVLILAFTSFSLNLYRELFYPAMSLVSQTTPGPFESRTPRALHDPLPPAIGWPQLLDQARAEAARRGWPEPVGDVFYSDTFVVLGVRFYAPGTVHDAGGMKIKNLYYDGLDGRLLGEREPWKGTAADVFAQLQFPLHSGRILGTTGRVLVSLAGVAVVVLSVTGIVIWLRKRRAQPRALAQVRDKGLST